MVYQISAKGKIHINGLFYALENLGILIMSNKTMYITNLRNYYKNRGKSEER